MFEKIIGFLDVEGYGRIDFVKHNDKDEAGEYSWRANNLVGEVTNRSARFQNPDGPLNDIEAIIAANGNPFKP